MALSRTLIDKLACPKCKGPLEYREKEESLECRACALSYPITDGIPVLLIDEARAI